MPGPKPKANVVRLLKGNPGHRKGVNRQPVRGVGSIGPAPDWFDAVQRAAWAETVRIAPVGVLTASDRMLVTIWCCALVEYRKAAQAVRRGGQMLPTKAGNPVMNQHLSIMNRQAVILTKCLGEFGFSPAARMRLDIVPGAGDGNDFAEFVN